MRGMRDRVAREELHAVVVSRYVDSGLTRDELAARAGLRRSSVTRVLRRVRLPSLALLQRVSAALPATLTYAGRRHPVTTGEG